MFHSLLLCFDGGSLVPDPVFGAVHTFLWWSATSELELELDLELDLELELRLPLVDLIVSSIALAVAEAIYFPKGMGL